MSTFDIKYLYVNIPITETLAITKHLLSKHNEEHITTQILMLLETVLQQLFLLPEQHLLTRERGFNGIPYLQHRCWNILTVPRKHIPKAYTRVKTHCILHKIRRWYTDDIQHKIYHPRNNPSAHQQDTPQLTVHSDKRTQQQHKISWHTTNPTTR
jgi:hypothetical protein